MELKKYIQIQKNKFGDVANEEKWREQTCEENIGRTKTRKEDGRRLQKKERV